MNPKKVFLVEDDDDDQYFFINAISCIGDLTLQDTAANGKDALNKLALAEFLPDVIVSDINMPQMNGLDLLHEILNDPLLKSIPVIILSTSRAEAGAVATLGAKAFITKPFDRVTLINKLERSIDSIFAPTGKPRSSNAFLLL